MNDKNENVLTEYQAREREMHIQGMKFNRWCLMLFDEWIEELETKLQDNNVAVEQDEVFWSE